MAVVDSITIKVNELFSFLNYNNNTKHSVESRYSTRNVLKIGQVCSDHPALCGKQREDKEKKILLQIFDKAYINIAVMYSLNLVLYLFHN